MFWESLSHARLYDALHLSVHLCEQVTRVHFGFNHICAAFSSHDDSTLLRRAHGHLENSRASVERDELVERTHLEHARELSSVRGLRRGDDASPAMRDGRTRWTSRIRFVARPNRRRLASERPSERRHGLVVIETSARECGRFESKGLDDARATSTALGGALELERGRKRARKRLRAR